MGSFSVRLPVNAPPAEFFKDIPETARTFLRGGFAVLSRLYPQYSQVLLSIPAETLVARTAPEPDEVAAKLGIGVSEASSLLGALSFLALVATSSPIPPESIADTAAALLATNLLTEKDKPAAEAVLTYFQAEQSKIKGAFQRVAVSTSILPTLDDFDVVVDVRMSFDKGAVAIAVPVAIVHLDTDVIHEEMWFQITKQRLQSVVKELTKALEQLEQAERWAQSRS